VSVYNVLGQEVLVRSPKVIPQPFKQVSSKKEFILLKQQWTEKATMTKIKRI
jgi:hypothetical protein